MSAEIILQTLIRLNLVASAAILLILLLRPFVLRWLGPRIAWWLWMVLPTTVAASFVPAQEQIVLIQPSAVITSARAPTGNSQTPPIDEGTYVQAPPIGHVVTFPTFANMLVIIWLAGAGALLARSTINTRRTAADPTLGPALVGVFKPRLVLPSDFATRFDAQEQTLILAHEEVHRISGHTIINALVELARCGNWFNPLMHIAANKIRIDQELACDATVIAAHPTARRVYAEALLKAQIFPATLPLGCTWTSKTGELLARRIELLTEPSLTRRGAIAGVTAVAICSFTFAYVAWAQQPEQVVTQVAPLTAVWTPAANAPAGLMTPLESDLHDRLIARAQQGNIDFVYISMMNTEMWSWQDSGRPALGRTLGPVTAAINVGSRLESLLWRMQHGELDGYQAKLIVVEALRPDPPRNRNDEIFGTQLAIAKEIRGRQPQAKILMLPDLPQNSLTLEQWREVLYIKNPVAIAEHIGLEPIWARSGKPGDGEEVESSAFEFWTEEMQPWMDRFVR